MRMTSMVKVALLAVTVALPASFSVAAAKGKMAPPPGSCAFEKGWIASGTICSHSCDPATMVCAQQICVTGTKTPVLPCFSAFCTPKCGG
jgi:hypothetical protein